VVLTDALTASQIVEIDNYLTAFLPTNALRTITTFTATAAQTTFSVTYTQGLIDVFYNGSCLAQSEYTAINGTSVILATACQVNDIVVVYAYNYSVGAYSGIGGSGTTNYVSKFSSSSTIGNSVLFDNGTNVGINTTSPQRPLHVHNPTGAASIAQFTNSDSGSGAEDGLLVGITGSEEGAIILKENLSLWFATNDTERMRITATGNVGINTSSPGYLLDVAGTSRISTGLYFNNSATNGAFVWQVANESLRFGTNDTERMRITSGGVVQINTTAGGATLNLKAQAGNNIIRLQNTSNGDGSIYAYGTSTTFNYAFNTYSVADAFYLYNSGNYDFAGSDVSDRRLKENINTIDYNATEKLMQLVPKSYNMIKHPDTKRNGFIAQEVQKILPDLITGTESEDDYLGLDYNGLLAIAVKAIQELKAEVEQLKQK
jgi:hypothetical protein